MLVPELLAVELAVFELLAVVELLEVPVIDVDEVLTEDPVVMLEADVVEAGSVDVDEETIGAGGSTPRRYRFSLEYPPHSSVVFPAKG